MVNGMQGIFLQLNTQTYGTCISNWEQLHGLEPKNKFPKFTTNHLRFLDFGTIFW